MLPAGSGRGASGREAAPVVGADGPPQAEATSASRAARAASFLSRVVVTSWSPT